MKIETNVESVSEKGVTISFRVRGFPICPVVHRLTVEIESGRKFKVGAPTGFRGAKSDGSYESLEEFESDFLADEPNASTEQIRKAYAAEQRRISKENSSWLAFTGNLKLKWFKKTFLFVPLDGKTEGSANLIFGYSYRQSGLLEWPKVQSAVSAVLTLPNKGMKPTGLDER